MKFFLPITFLASTFLAVEARWKPTPGLTWDYLLGGDSNEVMKSDKQVVTFDLEYAEKVVPTLHKNGQKAVCYFSGGTTDGKPDKEEFVKAGLVINDDIDDGWNNKWLNVKDKEKLQPLLRKRFQRAYKYGCDAVEVDCLNIYEYRSDFTKEDSYVFAKWLAETAHEENISIGLKNLSTHASRLEPYYDFAVVESCAAYSNECNRFKPFTDNNKAVFIVHYGNLGWKLSGSKLTTLIKEQSNRKFTCVISEHQYLRTHSINYDCNTGAVIEGKGNASSTSTTSSVNRCGPGIGTCATGCCSKKGYCGTTNSYCGAGCQVGYGNCKCGKITSNGKTTDFGSCPSGYCCSTKGYCGKTDSFCGTGCQADFGTCKCGKVTSNGKTTKYGSCPSGYCCSKKGYCGKTSAFCGSGCQSSYGKCD